MHKTAQALYPAHHKEHGSHTHLASRFLLMHCHCPVVLRERDSHIVSARFHFCHMVMLLSSYLFVTLLKQVNQDVAFFGVQVWRQVRVHL